MLSNGGLAACLGLGDLQTLCRCIRIVAKTLHYRRTFFDNITPDIWCGVRVLGPHVGSAHAVVKVSMITLHIWDNNNLLTLLTGLSVIQPVDQNVKSTLMKITLLTQQCVVQVLGPQCGPARMLATVDWLHQQLQSAQSAPTLGTQDAPLNSTTWCGPLDGHSLFTYPRYVRHLYSQVVATSTVYLQPNYLTILFRRSPFLWGPEYRLSL
jgi:hypothetical protein